MRIGDLFILSEATLAVGVAQAAWRALQATLQRWTERSYAGVLGALDLRDGLADYQAMPTGDDPYDAKAWDRRATARDRLLTRLEDGLRKDQDLRQRLGDDLRDAMEQALQAAARAHVEDTFGEIDPFVRGADYDSQTSKHLFWLQHILVHIRTDAVDQKSGKPKTSGGYFAKFPSSREFAGHATSKREVNWQNDVAVGIMLFADKDDLRHVASHAMVSRFHEAEFGEDMTEDRPLERLMQHMVPTFVHEVGHLEQDIRRQLRGWSGTQGISYLPNPGKARGTARDDWPGSRRGSDLRNGKRSFRHYKPGKRGHPDHLNGGIPDGSEVGRWSEYFGTRHEIDAHAAGAAAAMVLEWQRDHERNVWRAEDAVSRQAALNGAIDDLVQSLSWGYGPSSDGSSSYRSYVAWVKDRISDAERPVKQKRDAQGQIDPARRRYPLPKVDTLHRKVWRLFMLKLAKHLLALKRPLPYADPDDWRREDNPEPRPARVGGIVHPAKRPRLDGMAEAADAPP